MYKMFVFLFFCVCLGACAPMPSNITPEIRAKMMEDLEVGSLVLDSQSFTTDVQFSTMNAELIRAHNEKDWSKLAELTMQIGHEKDIAYYYLGSAAEGLGYLESSIVYYERALFLYHDDVMHHHCREFKNDCGGLDLKLYLPIRMSHVREKIAKIESDKAILENMKKVDDMEKMKIDTSEDIIENNKKKANARAKNSSKKKLSTSKDRQGSGVIGGVKKVKDNEKKDNLSGAKSDGKSENSSSEEVLSEKNSVPAEKTQEQSGSPTFFKN